MQPWAVHEAAMLPISPFLGTLGLTTYTMKDNMRPRVIQESGEIVHEHIRAAHPLEERIEYRNVGVQQRCVHEQH